MIANKIFRNAALHESLLLLCTVCKIWKVSDLLQRARSVLSHCEIGTGIIDLFWSLLSGVFFLSGCPNILKAGLTVGRLNSLGSVSTRE